jgi:hypothetical protein
MPQTNTAVLDYLQNALVLLHLVAMEQRWSALDLVAISENEQARRHVVGKLEDWIATQRVLVASAEGDGQRHKLEAMVTKAEAVLCYFTTEWRDGGLSPAAQEQVALSVRTMLCPFVANG